MYFISLLSLVIVAKIPSLSFLERVRLVVSIALRFLIGVSLVVVVLASTTQSFFQSRMQCKRCNQSISLTALVYRSTLIATLRALYYLARLLRASSLPKMSIIRSQIYLGIAFLVYYSPFQVKILILFLRVAKALGKCFILKLVN